MGISISWRSVKTGWASKAVGWHAKRAEGMVNTYHIITSCKATRHELHSTVSKVENQIAPCEVCVVSQLMMCLFIGGRAV